MPGSGVCPHCEGRESATVDHGLRDLRDIPEPSLDPSVSTAPPDSKSAPTTLDGAQERPDIKSRLECDGAALWAAEDPVCGAPMQAEGWALALAAAAALGLRRLARFLGIAGLVVLLAPAPGAEAASFRTDIAFVLDGSASFAARAPFFADGLADMSAAFNGLGVDARYGLVTFATTKALPLVVQDFTDAATLETALRDPMLTSNPYNCALTPCLGTVPNNLNEPGTLGVAVALGGVADFREGSFGAIVQEPYDILAISGGPEFVVRADAATMTVTESQGPQPVTLSWRDDAVKNVVLLADEGDARRGFTLLTNGHPLFSWADVADLAIEQGALVNAIIDFGSFGWRTAATSEYGFLATQTGGNVFDLDVLDTGDPALLAAFVNDFAAVKFAEIRAVCDANPLAPGCRAPVNAVPLPPALWLAVSGFASLVWIGRSRHRHRTAA